MFGQTGPEMPNQAYQELIRTAEQERVARSVIRERRAARRLERQAARIAKAASRTPGTAVGAATSRWMTTSSPHSGSLNRSA